VDSILRDLNREQQKMQADVINLNRHYENLRDYVRQYLEATTIEWAKLVIDHPRTLLLAVETTHIVDENGNYYNGNSEPVRLTALELVSGEIWDQKVLPTYSKRVQGTEYHGIVLADLLDKPRLADVWPEIVERFDGKHLIIFGADWARSAIRTVQPVHLLALDNAVCLHNKCKEYYSEFYEISLEKVLNHQGINKTRYELRDSRDRVAMLDLVVRNLATGLAKQEQNRPDDSLSDLDDHPF
jgi:DNA polymerase III epsilon subunit-like protein